jgi:membrane-associated phospholipid phosphatase
MGQMYVTTLRRTPWPALTLKPLLPVRLRRLAAVLLAAWAAVPVVLAVRFVGHGQPGSLDSAIDPQIMNDWRHSTLRHWLFEVGTLGPVTLMTVALVVACAATRRWSGAVLAAFAAPAATSLTEYVLKPYVGGPLGQGFPSRHATSMFALAAICAVLLADPPHRRVPRAVRLLLAVMALALATAVAVTVIASGAHTFTDALAGAAVGTGVVLACAFALDLVVSRSSRFLFDQSAKLAQTNHEARVQRYFYEYVDRGRPGYVRHIIRHPGKSFGALIALVRLPCLRVACSLTGIESATIQDFLSPCVTALLSPRSILTRIIGIVTAVLIIPIEHGQYSLGASKQTLRRKVRSSRKLGVSWAEVTDPQERQKLIKLAEEYERNHPNPIYRTERPDLGWLLNYRLWLVAYSAVGNPLVLSVTPIDGEFALLRYFRTIGDGEGQGDARYLMTEVLVEHLVDHGVRYLVDGGGLAMPNGIRHFHRMVGFRLFRIRVVRGRPGRASRAYRP